MRPRTPLLCALLLTLVTLGPAAAASTLRDVLAQALETRRVPPDLFVHAGWKQDAVTYRTLDVWADGVGIQDDRVQFRLPDGALLVLVRDLLDSGFPGMDASSDAMPDQGLRIRSRVRVRAGGEERDVFRTLRSGPSPELDRLVEGIASLCAQPASAGVTAASLEDALSKLRRGVVAPQALRLTFQQLEEKADEQGVRAGWMVRLAGRDLEVRTVRPGQGAGPVESRRISDREWRALTGRLRGARLGSTPAVLFSERYEDLSIAVLGRDKQVQARRFSGASPGGSPAQKRYEKLRRLLRELYDGTASGRP